MTINEELITMNEILDFVDFNSERAEQEEEDLLLVNMEFDLETE